ncbi:MAG: hypothetical protein ACXQTM_00500 [Methanosarcinales archaeon]
MQAQYRRRIQINTDESKDLNIIDKIILIIKSIFSGAESNASVVEKYGNVTEVNTTEHDESDKISMALEDKTEIVKRRGITLPEKLPDDWMTTSIQENYSGPEILYENHLPVIRVDFENPRKKVNITTRTGEYKIYNASVTLYFVNHRWNKSELYDYEEWASHTPLAVPIPIFLTQNDKYRIMAWTNSWENTSEFIGYLKSFYGKPLFLYEEKDSNSVDSTTNKSLNLSKDVYLRNKSMPEIFSSLSDPIANKIPWSGYWWPIKSGELVQVMEKYDKYYEECLNKASPGAKNWEHNNHYNPNAPGW